MSWSVGCEHWAFCHAASGTSLGFYFLHFFSFAFSPASLVVHCCFRQSSVLYPAVHQSVVTFCRLALSKGVCEFSLTQGSIAVLTHWTWNNTPTFGCKWGQFFCSQLNIYVKCTQFWENKACRCSRENFVIAGLIVPFGIIYYQPIPNFWNIMSQTPKGAAHCNLKIFWCSC